MRIKNPNAFDRFILFFLLLFDVFVAVSAVVDAVFKRHSIQFVVKTIPCTVHTEAGFIIENRRKK